MLAQIIFREEKTVSLEQWHQRREKEKRKRWLKEASADTDADKYAYRDKKRRMRNIETYICDGVSLCRLTSEIEPVDQS